MSKKSNTSGRYKELENNLRERRKKLEKLQADQLRKAVRYNYNPLRNLKGQGCNHRAATWPDHYFVGRKEEAHDFNKPNYSRCAKACGVGRMHISRILRGLANPSADLLEKMANYYGLGMGELWKKLKEKRQGKPHAPHDSCAP